MPKRLLHALDPSIENSPAFLTALGRLVAESAMLEAQVDTFAWHLLSNDQRSAQIATADLDFRRKVNLLGSLLHHYIPENEAALRKKAIGEVKGYHSLYDERNEYIHGMWAPSSTNEKRGLIRVSTKKGFYKFSVADVPVEKITGLADRFYNAAVRLGDIQVEFLLS